MDKLFASPFMEQMQAQETPEQRPVIRSPSGEEYQWIKEKKCPYPTTLLASWNLARLSDGLFVGLIRVYENGASTYITNKTIYGNINERFFGNYMSEEKAMTAVEKYFFFLLPLGEISKEPKK